MTAAPDASPAEVSCPDVHAPGYYLHIDNGGCFFAAGMWRPAPEALAKIRKRILERPNEWKKARGARAFQSTFELGGERLKRPPRGYSEDTPHIEDVKRKDFIASSPFPARQINDAAFVATAARTFGKASPFRAFLCAAQQVPF